ncbi:UDP-N-acetylglucosamine transporter TMEM241 isoform 3-T3 [Molossus nigricans]
MCMRRCLVGLTFCTCYLASYLTNKYVLSVLKFTYPTLFQGWQTLIGGLLLHVSWKLGWVEINSSSSPFLYFSLCTTSLKLSSVGTRSVFRKSALFLLAAAGYLPFNDSQFDPDGYFWAVIHLFCVGAYKILQKSQKPNALSDIDQQYFNYIFSLLSAQVMKMRESERGALSIQHSTGHWGHHTQRSAVAQINGAAVLCGAPGICISSHSGFLGFFLMFSTVKLKSLLAPGQCAAWIFFAKPPARWTWRGLARLLGAEGRLKVTTGKGDPPLPAGEDSPRAAEVLAKCQKEARMTASRCVKNALRGVWAAAEMDCDVFLFERFTWVVLVPVRRQTRTQDVLCGDGSARLH